MKMGRLQWGVIGIVTLLIVVTAPSDNESANTKVARSENRHSSDTPAVDKQQTHAAGHVELGRLAQLESRSKDKGNVGDAFNTDSWNEPPPRSVILQNQIVAPVPPPVAVQMAPPLPFTYLGRYGDTPSRIIILSKGERVYTVAVGDVIENTYRVEKFTPGMINLTYLPLSIEQHLTTGEAL
jgi:hypothetical protein